MRNRAISHRSVSWWLMVGVFVAVTGGGPAAQFPETGELRSVPIEGTPSTVEDPQPSAARLFAPATAEDESAAPTIGGIVTVGLNREISRLFGGTSGSTFIPPDTMGAVGPHHIVEMINGNFEILDKTTGASIETRSLDSFWTTRAGLGIINNGRFDPRVIYDAASERWFAVSIDNIIDADNNNVNEAANNVFIARSDTDDPTQDWDGVSFLADSVGALEFHDYPTLGIDADGVYICTQDFDGGGNESCYSIPKADLLLPAPSVANLTRFEATPAGLPAINGSWQAAVNFGLSAGRAPVLGSTGTALQRTNIFGSAAAGAFLGAAVPIAGDPGHAAPGAARQPQDTDAGDNEDLENVAPRFVGNVVMVGGSLWAAHAVEGPAAGGNSAVRWYRIDEATNTIIQTGDIEDANIDFHEPSIAVNQFGHVVIGYTCSGRNLPASVCASVGTTSGAVTTFQPPAVLFAGSGTYYRDFCTPPGCSERNRWGDYSATVVDPADPYTFWTFQEYVANTAAGDIGPGEAEDGEWGVRVVELTFNEGTGGDLGVTKICKPDTPVTIPGTGFCEVNVTNFGPGSALGVVVVDRYLSNGTFTLGTPTTTKGTCTVTPNPQSGQGMVTCDLGRLAKNETVLIHVDVTASSIQTVNDVATATSESDDPDPTNNQDEGSLNFVDAAADLSVTKVCEPSSPLLAGGTATCTITVHNFGPLPAQTVTLVDAHTSNGTFTFGSIVITAGACVSTPNPQVNAGNVTCTIASIASGADVILTVPITAAAPQTIGDTATVDAVTPDPNNANNIASGSVSFTGLANLALTKSDAPDPVIAGTNLTYTFNVSNSGPSAAVNVKVSDLLPATLSVVSVSSSVGTCNAGSPGSVPTTCNFDTLASGAAATMTIVALVNPSVPAGTLLSNNATVTSETVDNDNSNNLATSVTTVITSADLTIVKSDSPDPAVAGGSLTYLLRITNLGPSWARDVVVSDTLPTEVTLVSATGPGATCVPLAGTPTVVQCTLGDLGNGAVRDITIQTTVSPSAPDNVPISNLATVVSAGSTPTPDPVLANNTDSENTLIITRADLWIDKTGFQVTGNPSRTIQYNLTVYNKPGCEPDDPLSCGAGGPSDAQNVVVTDFLPLDRKKLRVVFVPQNCVYNPLTHRVTCTVAGPLPAGQTATFTIYVQVAGSVGEFTNGVTVTSSTADPNPANNSDLLKMVVKGGTARPSN